MKNIKDSITTAPRTGVLADFFEKTALGELGEPNNTYLGDINLFKNDEKMSSFYLIIENCKDNSTSISTQVFPLYWRKNVALDQH